MFSYLIRRLFTSILVLFGISMLVFSVIHLVPGDVTMAILGRQKVTEEKVAELREQLGLNDPLYVQYGRYLSKAISAFRSATTCLFPEPFPNNFQARLRLRSLRSRWR